jgi:hypothetical protein
MPRAWTVLLCTVAGCGELPFAAGDSQDAYVWIDAAARATGWQVRVPGFSFPPSTMTPIAVSDEGALLYREGESVFVHQRLHPPPGRWLRVRGPEATIDLAPDVVPQRALVRPRDATRLFAFVDDGEHECPLQLLPGAHGLELHAPGGWPLMSSSFDELLEDSSLRVDPDLPRAAPAGEPDEADFASPRVTSVRTDG